VGSGQWAEKTCLTYCESYLLTAHFLLHTAHCQLLTD
jgi:hypothetical protein